MTVIPYFDATPALSYNAILNFINSNRTYGKTWGFKIRAWKRAVKRGKKCIWVRRFKEEAKECASAFYTSKNLQKKCGIIPYDPITKTGNFKQIGRTMYVKRGKKWVWFCKVVHLAKSNAMRSADDVDVDTIIFDEYTTTPEKYARYRGNEVTDFLDLFFSAKREHIVNIFLLGNNEHIVNPYFDYFKIPALPESFEGIKTYKSGTILVQKINNPQRKNGSYSDRVEKMLKGTSYGDYIYQSAYKDKKHVKTAKTPLSAVFYAQVVYNNNILIIRFDNGLFYIDSGNIDYKLPVFVDKLLAKYPNEVLINGKTKQWLEALQRAIMYGLIRYRNNEIAERAFTFIKKLST